MADMQRDEFEEFETPPEEILAVLDEGEPVRFGTRFVVRHSTIPLYGKNEAPEPHLVPAP